MERRPHLPEHTHPHHDFQFGAPEAEADLHPQLWAYGLRLYTQVRRAYEASGRPLGHSDESMLIWFTFGDPEGNNEAAGSFEAAKARG